jgi:hypothetical protein
MTVVSGSLSGTASLASTASSADNFLVRNTLTAQTLVVQTVTSSVIYSSGSNVFGNNIANTQVLTGSVTVTGSLAVVTNGTEFQVTNTGVRIGNIITDAHPITGSINVSGSATFLSNVTSQNDSAYYRLKRTSGSDLGYITDSTTWGDSGTDFAIGASSANLRFYTNNSVTERMRITSNGDVSIGTTTTNTNTKVKIKASSEGTGIGLSSSTLSIVRSATDTFLSIGYYSTPDAFVLSTSYGADGAYKPIAFATSDTERMRISAGGYLKLKTVSSVLTSTTHRLDDYQLAEGSTILVSGNASQADTIVVYSVANAGQNAAATALAVGRHSSTLRSINAGGSINASGVDYAEYMTKATTDVIAKGDIVGVNSVGKLTNIFNDAISFVVKSTDPSYVGGDIWGSTDIMGIPPGNEATQEEKDEYNVKLEAARATVDRIAFSGQVPCNVTGANVGDYIIPIELENGKIGGQAITNPTFEQYQISVGKVWKIMEDGRAWIAVKIG